jgi:aminoglycoside/choline kinase family phosphotransferase
LTPDGDAVRTFLERAGWSRAHRQPVAADWSTRRYERLRIEARTAILMDADGSPLDAFVRIDRWLRTHGLHAPEILAEEAPAGLLLLEDLGDDLMARAIARGADERRLYELALAAILRFQQPPPPGFLPLMTDTVMIGLLDLFLDHGDTSVAAGARRRFQDIWAGLLPRARVGGEVFLHRDYHAENLLWLPREAGLQRLGIIDFQDAFAGPALYDLVSLAQDARRDISPAVAAAVVDGYLAARPELDAEAAREATVILGAHRAMRILGVAGRLTRREGRRLPAAILARVEGHLRTALRHPVLEALHDWCRQAYPSVTVSR